MLPITQACHTTFFYKSTFEETQGVPDSLDRPVSHTPKPIVPVHVRHLGFHSVAMPDLRDGPVEAKAVPAVPRLPVANANCLTRPPPVLPPKLVASGFLILDSKFATFHMTLSGFIHTWAHNKTIQWKWFIICFKTPIDGLLLKHVKAIKTCELFIGQGFVPDVGCRLHLGSGAYASVRCLRHAISGQSYALKIVEKHPLEVRQMMPQLQREIGLQNSLRHKHILRVVSTVEDPL